MQCTDTDQDSSAEQHAATWSYAEAFSRNLGLINPAEQERLRNSRVAIAGMGGVGGVHLMTLVRLGVGSFRIADPDTFEVANSNRQYGAQVDAYGMNKARSMADKARAVNPEVKIDVLEEAIGQQNIDRFLDGVDVLVDGIDFFSHGHRRLLFSEARRRNIWALTAGPIGFSTAWLLFDPAGMSFDEYFDLDDDMDSLEQFTAFLVGLTPRGTHFPYLDLTYVDAKSGRGPSVGAACHLASGVVAAEVSKILLDRGGLRPAPCFSQFDAYRAILRRGTLRWGNRGPLQRMKRRILRKKMLELGFEPT